MRLIEELRKRNVHRVALAYLAVAWLAVQVSETLFPIFGVPDSFLRWIVIALVVGFPLALALSWFYELTPEGILETAEADAKGYGRTVRLGRKFDFVIIGVLAVAVVLLAWDKTRAPQIDAGAIAVLPFANLTDDPTQTWLSDGIAVEILNDLGEIPGIRLVGRKSSFRFRGDDLDLRDVGTALGVDILLEGSVRRDSDTLRIAAQLVSAADGYEVWSGSYERTLDDVLETQDEIARAVVGALKPHLGLDDSITRPARIQTTSDAYTEYLQGIYFIDRIFAPGQVDTNLDASKTALEHMQRATELAPNFAMAWAGRVRAQIWSTGLTGSTWDEIEPQVEEWLGKALELGDDIAEVHFAAASWYEGDRAIVHLRRAIEINPNYAEAFTALAHALRGNSKFGEYFVVAAKAAELDPLDNWSNWTAMYAAFHRGDHGGLEAMISENRRQWPTANALADEVHLRFELGQFEHWPQLHERADALGPGWGLDPPNWIGGPPRYFGDGYLTLGLVEPARRFLEWRYKDVIDLYNGDTASAIEFLSGELQKSREAMPGYYRSFQDVVSSLIENYLYSDNYAGIVETMENFDIRPQLFDLPYPERTNPPWPQVAYTFAQFQLGNDELGERWLDALVTQLEDRLAQGVSLPNHYYELARVRAMQGRNTDALSALRRAIDMGWRRWYFDRDPILEPVRQEAGFAALQERYDADLSNKRRLVDAAR